MSASILAMRFAEGALKRGYTEAAVRHALDNYTDTFVDQGDHHLVMFIGGTPSGELIEVGAIVDDNGAVERIVHVMSARSKYLRHKNNG